MRSLLVLVALLPVMIVLDVALWLAGPDRRVTRSAIVAGVVVGRVAAGAAC